MANPSSASSSVTYSTSTPLPELSRIVRKNTDEKCRLTPTLLIDCAQSKGFSKSLIERAFQNYNPFAFQSEEQFIDKLRLLQSKDISASSITISIIGKKKNSAQPDFSPSVQEPLSKKINLNTSDRYKPRLLNQLINSELNEIEIAESKDDSVILLSSTSSSESSSPEKPKCDDKSIKASTIFEAVHNLAKNCNIINNKVEATEQIKNEPERHQSIPQPQGAPKIKKQLELSEPKRDAQLILDLKQPNRQQEIVATVEKKPEPVKLDVKEINVNVVKQKPTTESKQDANLRRLADEINNRQKSELKVIVTPLETVSVNSKPPPPVPVQEKKVNKKPAQMNNKSAENHQPLKPTVIETKTNKEPPLLDCLLKQMKSDPILGGSKNTTFKIPTKPALQPLMTSPANQPNCQASDMKEKPKQVAPKQLPPLMPHDRDLSEPRITNRNSNTPRFIAIDGSNVAREHGKSMGLKAFSCTGIKIVVDYFLKRGHTQVKAVVPRFRRGKSDQSCPSLNPEQLDLLENAGYLTYTPSRYIEGQGMVVPYDDRFIIEIATHFNGVIVSNDNYRDLQQENSKWKTFIQRNLLQFSFVGDLFIVPSDPFGRKGPDIDEFLGSSNSKPPPPPRPPSPENQPNHVSRMRAFNKSEQGDKNLRRPFSENRRQSKSRSRGPRYQ